MTTTARPNGAAAAGANIEPSRELNPFQRKASNAVAEVENQRAIAETIAALQIAKRFPRDQVAVMDKILQACTRPALAEVAMYQYARGGQDITGPSIRLAEAIAQNWGNFEFGLRELEQRPGESSAEAFAWDLESNTRSSQRFQVPHERHTRSGVTRLTDPRDIYETVANNGARRVRARILSIIPGDVVEAAVIQCETTLRTRIEITPETIESLVNKFGALGVSRKALEGKIQRRLEAITPALVVNLGKIYNSIKDGMSAPIDWFEIEPAEEKQGAARTASVRDKLAPEGPPAVTEPVPAQVQEQAARVEPSPASEDEPEAEMLAKMSGPDLTKFIKGEAKRLDVSPDELDEIVSSCGGWKKQNAEKILEGVRAFADAQGAGA
jgi:hypothetical protein